MATVYRHPAPSLAATIVRPPPARVSTGERTAWLYLGVLFALWVLLPEVRRLIGWRFGFPSIDVLSIVPFLAILPLGFPAIVRLKTMPKPIAAIFMIWIAAFVSAMLVAVAGGQFAPAAFGFVQFCFPLVVGAWAATVRFDLAARLRSLAFIFGTLIALAAIYGIVQFILAPAWDTNWLRATGETSMGRPFPFEIRTFGPLNSPGTLAAFIALGLPFCFAGTRGRGALPAALVGIFAAVALSLTLQRIVWLALPLEWIAYLLMLPRPPVRTVLVCAFAACIAVFALGTVGSEALPALAPITDRIQTFTDLNNDYSAQSRAALIGVGLEELRTAPNGIGLGTFGLAAKLGSASATQNDFELGPLERYLEMGVIGGTAYFVAVGAALVVSFLVWRRARERGDRDVMRLGAVAMAIQVAVFIIDIGGDARIGLNAVVYWLAIGLLLGREVRSRLDYRV